jgi:hypothetical protein
VKLSSVKLHRQLHYTNSYTNPHRNRLRPPTHNYEQILAAYALLKPNVRNNYAQLRAMKHKSLLPYKEGVAGSNPASPTYGLRGG